MSVYEDIGGREGVAEVVDAFYDRVLADDQLIGYFEDTDMDDLRTHQRVFIAQVVGGPERYDGEDMREAHAHLDLDEEDFDAVAGHLDDALAECGVEMENRETVMSRVTDLEDDVLNR
jgi:hemoglobin